MSAIVKVIVNTATASPLTEGSLNKVNDLVEQAQEILKQTQSTANKANESANNAANSADSAKDSATSAFAAAAPLWNDGKTYNPPDVVAGNDGNTYRCIKTNMNKNPVGGDGTSWKQITYNADGIITLDNENNVSPLTDTTGNIVPNSLGGNLGTMNKYWNNIYSNKINAKSMEINGQDIETLANGGRTILQRNTTYAVGEVVYSPYFASWMYAECIQPGTTSDVRPSSLYPATEIGATVDDGSSKWITRHIHDGHVKGEVFTLSGATFNGEGFLIHPVLNIVVKDVHVCDGTNDTPDLRGRFVIGTSEAHKENSIGGEETHKLIVDELPIHKPNVSMSSAGGHNHKYTQDTGARSKFRYITNDNGGTINDIEKDTSWNGEHTHPITVGNVGGDKPHNNMPPYYALVYVKKIK